MSIDEMEKLLRRLNIEPVNVRSSEILALCPGHKAITGKEDRNPSWWINSDTGRHICFSCGFKGGILSLVAHQQGFYDITGNLSYDEAKYWLAGSLENYTLDLLSEPTTPVRKEPEVKMSEASLAIFSDPPAEALKARGLTLEAAQEHGLLWNPTHKNWIIVIRDPYSNKLLGWQEKGFDRRYFNNYPQGMEKSISLFGYNPKNKNLAIVVESPLDVVRLTSLGIPGGVATYGVNVSKEQLKLIREYDQIIFAMDNDPAGKASSKNLLELTRTLSFEAWFFNYSHTDCKDVGAMSKAEITQGLKTAKHCVYGEAALSWRS